MQDYDVSDPGDLGLMASEPGGKFELFLKQEIYNHITRLECASAVGREYGICLRSALERECDRPNVVILRSWEADYLKACLLLQVHVVDDRTYCTKKLVFSELSVLAILLRVFTPGNNNSISSSLT